MQRYGNPKYCDEVYKDFAKFFSQNFAVPLIGPVMNLLALKCSGGYLTDDVHRNCITYISNCSEMSVTYKVLKPHLQTIICNVIFPAMCLSPSEIEMFMNEPQDFIQKVHNSWDDFIDPRAAASHLVQVFIALKYRFRIGSLYRGNIHLVWAI